MTSWLFTQVWLWSIAAFVLGVLINHVLFVRPLRRRLRVREEELAALEESIVDERNVPEPESGPLDLFDEDAEPTEEWNRNRPWARSRFTRTTERPGVDPRAGASRDAAEDGASTWVDPASRAPAAEPDVAPLPPRSPVPDASVTGAPVSGTSASGTSVSGSEVPGTWTDSATRRTAPDTGSTPEVPGADGQARGPAPVPATAGFERSATAKGGTETVGPVPVRETETDRYPVPAVHTERNQATDGALETGAGDLSNNTANTWFQKSAVDGTNTASAGQPDTAADPIAAESEVAARTAQTWTGQLAPPIEHGSAESANSTAAVGSPAAPEDAGVSSSDSAPDTAGPLPVRPATDASTDGAGSTDGSADLVSISSEPVPTETSDSAAVGNAPAADTATPAGTAVGSEAPADEVQHETVATPEAATPAHVTEQALANPTPTDPPSANPTQLDEPQLDNTQPGRTDGLPQRTPGAAARPGPDGDIVSGHVGPLIKGHAASRQYHTPDSPAYEQIVADVWFRSTADAEQAGFRSWNGR